MEGTLSAYDFDEDAFQALLDVIIEAGDGALELSREGKLATVRKGDESPVTVADRQVEAAIRACIETHFPGVGFLGEESGTRDADNRVRFVVDPIDGTRAFVRGMTSWSVLVSMEEDQVPVWVVAYMPALDEVYMAQKGQGAQMQHTVTGKQQVLQVSQVDCLPSCAVSHGALAQFTDAGLGNVLLSLAEHTDTQRGFGDFDGYRNLLLGRVDAVVDPGVKRWDVSAAALLVTEAGGQVSTFRKQSAQLGSPPLESSQLESSRWNHACDLSLLDGTAGGPHDLAYGLIASNGTPIHGKIQGLIGR